MSPEKFVVVVLLGILMLIILYKLLRRSIAWAKERRETYLISETFHFDQFKKAAHENDQKSISIKLYRWLDAMELKEPTATYFAKSYGSDDLQREVATIETNWGKGNQILNLHIREWESARKNYLNRGVVVEKAWINPV